MIRQRRAGFPNHDSCGFPGSRSFADDDLDIVIKGIQEVHEAFDGESVKLVVDQGRDLRLVHVEDAGGVGLRQATRLKDSFNGHSKADPRLLLTGVPQSEIGEHVPGT